VTWTNSDGATHTATGSGFDTGNISGGSSASVTFDTAGTFAYHCSIHSSMTGTVVVQAASGDATTPPTDALPTTGARDDTRGIGGAGALGLLVLGGLLGAASMTRRLARRRAG
jgi:hypothetical protein